MLRGISAIAALLLLVAPARSEIATWYGYENGPQTSSGERFDPAGFCADYPQHSCTCAHRDYAFGTYLKVRRLGRSVVCRVTDRGPNARTGADIDLSQSGARVLGITGIGRAHVSIIRVGPME